jgi:hypothetical protein
MKTFKFFPSIQKLYFMNKYFLFAFVVMAFMFASCQKDLVTNAPENAVTENSVAEDVQVSEAKQKLIAFIKANKLPPRFDVTTLSSTDARATIESRSTQSASIIPNNADFTFYKDVIKEAINPRDYVCGPTILRPYINNSVQTWTRNDFLFYNYFGGIPFDIAYVYDNTDGGQYFGPNGEFTNANNRVFKDLQRFWNIPNDILHRDAHGNIFTNIPKVTSMLLLYGYTQSEANEIAPLLKIVFGSANFRNYNHPLLTFNAFAAPADPDFNTPKKIVMGDGIQQAYLDLGFGDVAPQGILAHEYGHHVQFALNVNFVNTPEGTRRTELMADALSAYYLTHKRGAAMNWKRIQAYFQVAYSIGDCAFRSNGHHGTPNQRMKASEFGYQIANDAQKQGQILTAQAFIALFEVALPGIVAPDAN